MEKWFEKQSRLIQILLLVIPFVNYVVELLVRWDHFLQKKNLVSLVMAIIATCGGGLLLGYLDLIWCLLYKRLFLCD